MVALKMYIHKALDTIGTGKPEHLHLGDQTLWLGNKPVAQVFYCLENTEHFTLATTTFQKNQADFGLESLTGGDF